MRRSKWHVPRRVDRAGAVDRPDRRTVGQNAAQMQRPTSRSAVTTQSPVRTLVAEVDHRTKRRASPSGLLVRRRPSHVNARRKALAGIRRSASMGGRQGCRGVPACGGSRRRAPARRRVEILASELKPSQPADLHGVIDRDIPAALRAGAADPFVAARLQVPVETQVEHVVSTRTNRGPQRAGRLKPARTSVSWPSTSIETKSMGTGALASIKMSSSVRIGTRSCFQVRGPLITRVSFRDEIAAAQPQRHGAAGIGRSHATWNTASAPAAPELSLGLVRTRLHQDASPARLLEMKGLRAELRSAAPTSTKNPDEPTPRNS